MERAKSWSLIFLPRFFRLLCTLTEVFLTFFREIRKGSRKDLNSFFVLRPPEDSLLLV